VPVYSYRCETCGADLELLHAIQAIRTNCGLACLRRDSGPFGKGRIARTMTAANVVARKARPGSGRDGDPTNLRDRALERLGGDRITERDLQKARRGGLTVYRNEGDGTYVRDGGDPDLPSKIQKPKGAP
jgi:hypothetical protein